MEIDNAAGYGVLFLSILLIVGIHLKAYYHFQSFKAENKLDVSFFEFYINPFSYLAPKFSIYFPFVLKKSIPNKDADILNYRNYVVWLSWINLIIFFMLTAVVLIKS